MPSIQANSRSLYVKPLVNTDGGRRIASRASFQFLSARIDENYRALRRLEADQYFQECQLKYVLHTNHIEPLEADRTRSETKHRHNHKFDALVHFEKNHSRAHRRRQWYQERLVVNLSSKQLTESQTAVLARGLNFAPAPSAVPMRHIIANVEQALRLIPKQSADNTRLKIASLLRDPKTPRRNLTPEEGGALRTLRVVARLDHLTCRQRPCNSFT